MGTFTVFRIRGIPIRVHWTLLLFLPYLAYAISMEFVWLERLAGMHDVHLRLPPLIWGGLLALGLFASVTLHELAHAFVARHYGGRVRAITLMLLGGVSQMTRMPRRPLHEGLMAFVGPVTSLGLGVLLLAVRRALDGAADDLVLGLFYLGWMNLVLGLFNLIPAFPMDGGRVLRALLSGVIGRRRATTVATSVGRVLAVGLGALGLWGGNWLLLLIAVFVFAGAGAEGYAERVRGALDGLRIGDLVPALRHAPVTIAADATMAAALARMHELRRLDLVAVDDDGEPVSVLEARDVAFVPLEARAQIRVDEYLAPRPVRHVVVPWDTPVNDVMEAVAETGARHIVVIDPRMPIGDRITGTASIAEIEEAARIELTETAGVNASASASAAPRSTSDADASSAPRSPRPAPSPRPSP